MHPLHLLEGDPEGLWCWGPTGDTAISRCTPQVRSPWTLGNGPERALAPCEIVLGSLLAILGISEPSPTCAQSAMATSCPVAPARGTGGGQRSGRMGGGRTETTGRRWQEKCHVGEARGAARIEVTARCFSQGNLFGKRLQQQDLSSGVPSLPPSPAPARGLPGFTACCAGGAGMGALSLRGIHPGPGKPSPSEPGAVTEQ